MLLSIWEFMKEAIIAGGFGIFVGFFNHARKNKRKIMFPRKLKGSWDLGFLYDCMESAFGAFALVLAIGPSDWVRVLFVAVIGALNAEKVFDYLARQFEAITNKSIEQNLQKEITPKDEDNMNKDAK